VPIEPDKNDAVILAVTVASDAMVHPGKQVTLRVRFSQAGALRRISSVLSGLFCRERVCLSAPGRRDRIERRQLS
jgi:hypothetical protein